MKDFLTRPAWIEIDLDKFENNMKIIKDKVGEKTEIMSVVKSDAYRLGALPLSQVSLNLGINYYAVATLSEALSLRRRFDGVNIFILGYTPRHLYEEAIKNQITLNIYSLADAKVLNDLAEDLKEEAKIHIAFDSGMSRIGFTPCDEAKEEIKEIFKLENINVEGIFSHFAACESDPEFTERQFRIFTSFIDELNNLGCTFKYRHIANSLSVLFHDEYDLDMVRPGIIQFGYTDSDHLPEEFGLEEIISLKAQISSIREVKKGESVGYERFHICEKDTKVVTLPLGYADAFPRILSEKIEVLINGKRCKQIGLICMDQMMVDATGIDCKIGDDVVLIGRQGHEEIKVRDICIHSGDCETSFITHFNRRLPKYYYKNKELVHVSKMD
ncbi:alanine racemase [Peptoniphilus harei]|uniref:Alanine racemase n=1 Tax=Peptoniphilus harei TaxID=54005 RepID=A0A2X1YMM5_9FIRM|nr:alanine racemase [Peptoniphilus harei]QQT91167.1 alanine racemase [Peptoniphilus harei]SPY48801.1 Alanine racemase [Peptoniphilus harei]